MNWLKSFWKKLTASPDAPHVYVQNPSKAAPGERQALPEAERFGTFTPRAQQVLALARKEAERLNHNFLGTEHLLLGLIALGQGVAVNVLLKLGIDLEAVRAEVKKQVGTGPDQKMIGNIPYTPRVKKVLDLAKREAKSLNHTYIGTEHILLGLLREGDGVAARILRNLNVDIEKTRQEILKELDPNFVPPGYAPGADPSTTSPGPPKSVSLRTTSPPPPGDPVDTSKRYDVHCTDWSQGVTVYRNVRFKGVKHLFQRSPYDPLSGYVELEEENGQTVFISRGCIIRFTESGP
jgi:hypothetical protein